MMELVPSSSTRKRQFLYCGSTTIDHLPDALLTEIFLRLLLKSAKQCMVVCKHWYVLISCPDFGNRFLQLNYIYYFFYSYVDGSTNNGIHKLFERSIYNSSFRSYSSPFICLSCKPEEKKVDIVASCGDLTLFCGISLPHLLSVYFIWNLLTNKWIQLPFISPARLSIFTCDSANWSEKLCIGWYKKYGWPTSAMVGIPSLGMLFWISSTAWTSILVGLDPFEEGESPCFIALPDEPEEDDNRCKELAVCRGNLRLLEAISYYTSDTLYIRIWDLKDFEKNQWDLEYDICFSGLRSKNPTWFSNLKWYVQPLACDPNNGVVVYFVFDEKVVVCGNLVKQTLDLIYDTSANGDKLFCPGHGFIYALPWQLSIPSLPS